MYRRRRLSKETEHDNSNGFGTYPDQSGGSCRLLSAEHGSNRWGENDTMQISRLMPNGRVDNNFAESRTDEHQGQYVRLLGVSQRR